MDKVTLCILITCAAMSLVAANSGGGDLAVRIKVWRGENTDKYGHAPFAYYIEQPAGGPTGGGGHHGGGGDSSGKGDRGEEEGGNGGGGDKGGDSSNNKGSTEEVTYDDDYDYEDH